MSLNFYQCILYNLGAMSKQEHQHKSLIDDDDDDDSDHFHEKLKAKRCKQSDLRVCYSNFIYPPTVTKSEPYCTMDIISEESTERNSAKSIHVSFYHLIQILSHINAPEIAHNYIK